MELTKNTNLLVNPNFELVCDRAPNLCHFINEVALPTVSASPVNQAGPFGSTVKQHADKAAFTDLSVTFTVDEDLVSYTEALNWIFTYVKPQQFDEYKELNVLSKSLNAKKFSDLSIYTLTNKGNRNVEFTFLNAHPIAVSPPQLTIQNERTNPLTFSVDFAYDSFTIKKV